MWKSLCLWWHSDWLASGREKIDSPVFLFASACKEAHLVYRRPHTFYCTFRGYLFVKEKEDGVSLDLNGLGGGSKILIDPPSESRKLHSNKKRNTYLLLRDFSNFCNCPHFPIFFFHTVSFHKCHNLLKMVLISKGGTGCGRKKNKKGMVLIFSSKDGPLSRILTTKNAGFRVYKHTHTHIWKAGYSCNSESLHA